MKRMVSRFDDHVSQVEKMVSQIAFPVSRFAFRVSRFDQNQLRNNIVRHTRQSFETASADLPLNRSQRE